MTSRFITPQVITSTLPSEAVLTLRAATNQSTNIQEWRNSSGTVLSRITSVGSLEVVGEGTFIGVDNQVSPRVALIKRSDTNVPLLAFGTNNDLRIVQAWGSSAVSSADSISNRMIFVSQGGTILYQGSATQDFGLNRDRVGFTIQQSTAGYTGDILQLRTNTPTTLAGYNAVGQDYTGSTEPIYSQVGGTPTAASGTGTTATITLTSASNLAVGDLIRVSGFTPSGYNTSGSGALVTAVSNSGTFTVSYANTTTGAMTVAGTVSAPAQASITARSAGTVPLVIKSVSTATAQTLVLQNSAGSNILTIDSNGSISTTSSGGGQSAFLSGVIIGAGIISFRSASAPRIVFSTNTMTFESQGVSQTTIVKGFASQSANLQEWQNSSATVLARVDASGSLSAVSKSFDVEHPTKSGMRLRYGSLEGPENGVYVRGVTASSIIELPEYWTALVDAESITAVFTPVGVFQEVFLDKIEDNKVYIGGNLEKVSYVIYGERKDIDKLIVEY